MQFAFPRRQPHYSSTRYTPNTDSTASNLPGPGRTMDNVFTTLGRGVDRIIDRFAPPLSEAGGNVALQRTKSSKGRLERNRSQIDHGYALPRGVTPTNNTDNTTSTSNSRAFAFNPNSDVQWIPVPTAMFPAVNGSNSPGSPAVIVLPSLPESLPTNTDSDIRAQAKVSRRRQVDNDDPELLMDRVTERINAYFKAEGTARKQPHLEPIMTRMRSVAHPLDFEKRTEGGGYIIHRGNTDKLYYDIIKFNESFDPLVAEMVYQYPDFIFEIPRTMADEILDMFGTPENQGWIANVRIARKNRRRLRQMKP